MVVLAGLPVGVDPEATEDPADRPDHQHQIGKAEIPAVHFPASLVEFVDAGWLLAGAAKRIGKKKGNQGCLQKSRECFHPEVGLR